MVCLWRRDPSSPSRSQGPLSSAYPRLLSPQGNCQSPSPWAHSSRALPPPQPPLCHLWGQGEPLSRPGWGEPGSRGLTFEGTARATSPWHRRPRWAFITACVGGRLTAVPPRWPPAPPFPGPGPRREGRGSLTQCCLLSPSSGRRETPIHHKGSGRRGTWRDSASCQPRRHTRSGHRQPRVPRARLRAGPPVRPQGGERPWEASWKGRVRSRGLARFGSRRSRWDWQG